MTKKLSVCVRVTAAPVFFSRDVIFKGGVLGRYV